jgi:MFS family permease
MSEAQTIKKPTGLDYFGLNVTNFFLAELIGVILPFLSDFLKQKHWTYSQIGFTVAMVGLGTLLFQIPAGVVSDKIWHRRLLLAGSSITLGACYAVLPLVATHVFLVDGLLFISGIASAFFVPLLAALALSLAGHKGFDKTFGTNQSWNHAGNIAASLGTLACVKLFGIGSVFYVVGVLSVMASASLFIIRGNHLNPDLSKERSAAAPRSRAKSAHHHSKGLLKGIYDQFKHPCAFTLIITVVLFNIANAPTMATVALYMKQLGSPDDYLAWAIVIGQASMVPVAYLAARYCTRIGRKPVMAAAFIALTLRILLYPLTNDPNMILLIQVINGIDAGIYGVAIALICGDLTEGKEGFNTLLSIMQLAVAFGGVFGPSIQGLITQHFGFPAAFFTFAALSALGGIFFIIKMPETGDEGIKACKVA